MTLAEQIADLAVLIAPPSRQDWAEAMRAELPQIETGKWSWAMGSLWMACGESLRSQVASGRVRMLAGALVLGLGAMVLPITVVSNPLALPINPMQPVVFTVLLSVTGLLLFGGTSLLLARLSPPLASAGRWLFGFGGLGYALLQFSIVFFNRMGHYPFGWLQLDAAIASFSFALAGIALIAGLQRAFWTLAMGALAYSVLETARLLLQSHGAASYLIAANVLVTCLPALLLLAGGNLLQEARRAVRT